MRIKLSQLRNVIRSAVQESYGWPVESETSLFGSHSKIDVQNPNDPTNSSVKLPKGPNSRTNIQEGFKKPTRRELEEWSKGNYDEVVENDGDVDPCDGCGKMTPTNSLTKSKNESDGKNTYMCQVCMSGH